MKRYTNSGTMGTFELVVRPACHLVIKKNSTDDKEELPHVEEDARCTAFLGNAVGTW